MAVMKIKEDRIASVTTTADHLVLVDFSANWCAPCKMLEPVLEQLSDELPGRIKVYKVDIDDSPTASTEFGIKGVPTIIIFHEGREIDRMVGYHDRKTLLARLSKLADAKLGSL